MSIKIDKRTLEIAVKLDPDARHLQQLKDNLSEANREMDKLKDEKKSLHKPKKKDTQAWEEYQRKLKDVNDRMEKQKTVIQEAGKAIDAQKQRMGINALTLRDLNNELKKYNTILSNLTPGTEQFNKTKQHIDEVKNRIQELRNKSVMMAEESKGSLVRFAEQFNHIGFAINNALSIGDRIFSFGRKIYDWLDPMAQVAQEAEGIEHAFQRIDKPGMLDNLREQTRGMIDDVELMKQAVKFDDFNLPVEQLGTYLAYAQQKSKDTGESMEFLVNSIVTGLGRQSPQILDNLGLSAKQISEEAKKSGDFFGAVAKIIKENMAEAGDYVETSADRAASAAARLKNAQRQLGEAWLPVKESIDTTFTDLQIRLIDAVKWLIEHKNTVISLVSAFALYRAAVAAYAIQQKIANGELAIFNNLAKKSAIGLVSVAIALAIGKLIEYISRTKEAAEATSLLADAEREGEKSAAAESKRLEKLYQTTQDTNKSMDERLAAVKKIKSEYPAYFGQLSNEAILAGQAASQYRQLASDIVSAAKARAYGKRIEKIEEENIDLQQTYDDANNFTRQNKKRYREIRDRRNNGGTYTWSEAKFMRQYEKQAKIRSNALGDMRENDLKASRLAEKQQQYNPALNRYEANNPVTPVATPSKPDKKSGGGGSKDDPYQKDTEALQKAQRQRLNALKESLMEGEITEEEYRQRSKQLDMQNLAEKLALQEKYGKDTSDTQGQILDKQIALANERYQEQQKQMNGELSALQDAHNADMAGLAKMRLDGIITDEDEYHQRELEAEIDFQLQRIAIIKKYGGDTAQAEAELVNIRLKQQSAEKREALEAYEKELREYAKSHTASETNAHAADVNQAEYDAGLISFKEYQDRKTEILEESEQIRHDIRQQFVNQANELLQSAQSYFNAMQGREEARVDAKYKKLIAAAKKQGKDTTKLEEQQEAEKAAIKKKYAQKEFRMNVLKILADTATGIAALWKNPGYPWAIPLTAMVAAQGAMQLATAKAQQEQAAGLYDGGFSEDAEGFTADGNPKDVAGMIPVHKREFVINHKALQNPAVMEVAKTIDSYQKAGRPDMINSTALLRAAAMGGGLADGGFSQGTGSSTSSAASLGLTAEQSRVLEDCREYLRIISEDRGVTIREVRRKIREEELMEARASR